jgi:hypothetical protein
VDEVSWALEGSGKFSTNSIYHKLTDVAAVAHFKQVWGTNVLPRIKVFLWQLLRGRLPTGEQLAKRKGPSDGSCTFVENERIATTSSLNVIWLSSCGKELGNS